MVDRAYVRELRENEKRFLAPDLMSASAEVKAGLLFLPSMVGLYTTGREFIFKGRLTEKMVKNSVLPDIISSVDLSLYEKLYNYVNLSFNEKIPMNKYVSNHHIASEIYSVAHFLFAEDVYDVRRVGFRKFLTDLKENPSAEDIHEYYQMRRERMDPIRNNMMLFGIRNPDLSFLEGYRNVVIYCYEKALDA